MKRREAEEDEGLPATALALKYLREVIGVSRQELASRLGHSTDALLGKYERGDKKLSRDVLAASVKPIGHPPESVDALVTLHPFFRNAPLEQPPSPVSLNPDELRWINRTCLAVITGLVEDLHAEMVRGKKARKALSARRDAEERWPDLKTATPKARRELVETWPRYRTWAMAERACEASVKAAANSAAEALELASFALFIGERISGAPSFRSRIEGYCWGHIGNARRVGEDFNGADLAFVRAWDLWRAGAESDPDLLPEWKLYSLEASLRREQHRFADALERLDQASKRSGGNELAAARVLLKKSNVLEQMEDIESALKLLDKAAPLVEELRDPHLLFTHRYNRADLLCRLQRYKQAAPLLEAIRCMAIEQRDELSLTRVLWLDALVRAGLGRKEEAINLMEQVLADWTDREHPYDAALAALDLAELRLEAGQPADVRRTALTLAWIFDLKGVDREALAALALFCEAAKRDAATVELTQRVSDVIQRVKRRPLLR